MEERLRSGGIDVRVVRLQPWKIWLLVAMGAGLAVTLTLLVAGMFLILVPLFLIGGLVAKLVLGGTWVPAAKPRPGRPDVIEGHYEVVNVDRRPSRR